MNANNWRQLYLLGALVAIYSLLAALTYLIFPLDELVPAQSQLTSELTIPGWQLALANAAIGIFIYGFLGLAGFWLARRLDLPGVFRPGSSWKEKMYFPTMLGLGLGLVIGLTDQLFATLLKLPRFPQPSFPFSLVASITAAVGEEIIFRSFVLGLWAFLLHLILRRWINLNLTLRIGNFLAALSFAVAHLASAMLLLDVTSPTGIPALITTEILLFNGVIGWVAGVQYIRKGLMAAVGLHFGVDLILHVFLPLANLGS